MKLLLGGMMIYKLEDYKKEYGVTPYDTTFFDCIINENTVSKIEKEIVESNYKFVLDLIGKFGDVIVGSLELILFNWGKWLFFRIPFLIVSLITIGFIFLLDLFLVDEFWEIFELLNDTITLINGLNQEMAFKLYLQAASQVNSINSDR